MSESVGSTLKQRRESRHLSIEQVAEQTRVRKYYLQALENDDLSAIPSMVQARGFLRIYAEFLGLNLDELSSTLRSAESQSSISQGASPAEPLPAPAQPSVPPSEPRPRPSSFFSNLRNRFVRHSSAEAAAPETESAAPPELRAEPEVFVPVRVHEELPAAPEETRAPEPVLEPEPPAKPARVRKPSSRRTSNKKPVRTKAKEKTAKRAKSSDSTGTKSRVKKKIANVP